MVDDRPERLARVADAVLPDPVEDHDRVVDREADDGQQRGDEEGVELQPEQVSEDGEGADYHHHVVQQGDDRRGAEPEPEADPQVGEDEQLANDDQDCRAPDQVGSDDRPDGGDAPGSATLRRPEALDERLLQVVERRPWDDRRRRARRGDSRACRGAGGGRGFGRCACRGR